VMGDKVKGDGVMSNESRIADSGSLITHDRLPITDYPKVAIIILNWNGWKDTIECLESLYRITYPNYDVIVVDNGSEDDSIEKIKEYCEGKIKVESKFFEYSSENKPIKVIEYTREEAETGGKEEDIEGLPSNRRLILIKNEKNYGFARGNNIGMKYALKTLNPDYILLLNNDTVVDKRFLEHAVEVMGKKDIGIVTGKIYYYDDPQRIWAAGGHINMLFGSGGGVGHNQLDKGQFNEIKEVQYAPGTLALIRRSILEQVGFLPECYFGTGEEMEFAIKTMKKGYKIICNPNCIIFHKVGMSSNRSLKYRYNSWRTKLLFLERNFPKPFRKLWLILYRMLIEGYLKFIKKDYKELDIFLLAVQDHNLRKFIVEEDLSKAEVYLGERWR